MDINGIQVEAHGSGYTINIRLWVGAEEPQGKWAKRFLDGVTAEPLVGEAGPRGPKEETDASGDADKPKARRARRASPDAGSNEKGPEAPEDKPVAEGRRRRAKPAEAAGDDAGAEAPEDKPVARRRRRGGAAKADENPTENASTAGRRSRSRSTAATTAKSASSKSAKVSDEDLSKAATHAAEALGAPAVMEILEEFGVPKINALEGDQRQEFIDRLRDEAEKEG